MSNPKNPLSLVPARPLSRIAAPAGLSAAEAALWREVVDSKPAEWFAGDTAPLVAEYVRAVAQSDELDRVLKSMSEGGEGWKEKAKPIMDFMKMRDMETKRALMIATKLRLTPQSRYTPQSAATANKKAGGQRPWEM